MDGQTIAAVSTAVGESGIGIVRISGDDAIQIAASLFESPHRLDLADAGTHTIHHGYIVRDGRRIDEVLVSVMRAPRTYTREDVVEINCHGGIVATRAVLDAVLASGARLAERGEFTQRAFLNGRITLEQAQAVLEIIQAQTMLGLEAAVDRLGGRFSGAIAELRTVLAGVVADLEVQIDFPDLDVEIAELLPRIEQLRHRVDELLRRSESGVILREGVTVAIVGRPNVGKSTLLNALLAEERSIVTPVPGTTRDTVEEVASIEGVPIRFIDTAGLRTPSDPVESEGVRRTERALQRADLALVVLDRSEPLREEDRRLLTMNWLIPTILVVNKSDLPDRLGPLPAGPWKATIAVAAREGGNLQALERLLVSLLFSGNVPTRDSTLLLETWERDLLGRIRSALGKAVDLLAEGGTPDLVSEELQRAYRVAGELQGIDVSESILDTIFARFCVGK